MVRVGQLSRASRTVMPAFVIGGTTAVTVFQDLFGIPVPFGGDRRRTIRTARGHLVETVQPTGAIVAREFRLPGRWATLKLHPAAKPLRRFITTVLHRRTATGARQGDGERQLDDERRQPNHGAIPCRGRCPWIAGCRSRHGVWWGGRGRVLRRRFRVQKRNTTLLCTWSSAPRGYGPEKI